MWSNKNSGLGGRYKSHLKQNVASSAITRLRSREIFGVCNRSRSTRYVGARKRVFTTLPRRLAMPLASLVEHDTLYDDAHIFLGFSSCDRFLISYTEKIEESSHTGFLSHIYILHWWLFNPGARARKVGSVRLFANEEIEYSLYLCYAEWPNLKSQVIVYGRRKFSESCYITIAAVPSIATCRQCNLISVNTGAIEDVEDLTCNNRCVQHGFAIHFKQGSGASQLGVLNTSGLKIDGILVLNIGHSIAVISTGILSDDLDIEQLPLSSIKRAACEESVTDSELEEVLENDNQQEEINPDRPARILESGRFFPKERLCKPHNEFKVGFKLETSLQNDKEMVSSKTMQYSNTGYTLPIQHAKSSVYDIDSDDSDSYEHITLLKKSTIENKENISRADNDMSVTMQCQQMEFEMSLNSDPYFDPEPKSIVLGRTSKNNTENPFTLEYKCKTDASSENSNLSSANKLSFKQTYQKGACVSLPDNQSKSTSDHNCAKHLLECVKSSKCTFSSTMPTGIRENDGDSPITSLDNRTMKKIRASFLSPAAKSSPVLGISALSKFQTTLEMPRSDLNFVTPSPTPSDCSSSIHCSTDSNLFQSGVKSLGEGRNSDGLVSFSESLYGSIPKENITFDDPLFVGENSLFYCSMFCQGAAGEMLHPLKKGQGKVQTFSQHLVLDLEHVIFDILRTRCYMTYKYGYLVDYEANVMDVCSDTKSVVIHIVALLNVANHRSKTISEIVSGTDIGAVMQQAEFILCWRLHTGRYEVVVARPLKPYNEKESGDWKGDWIVKMDSSIKQKCAVRSSIYRSVYILDNSAVFRHRSLNVLWNCDKTIAVTK